MLVFDSSLRRHEFVSETVRRKYAVKNVASGQFALRVLRFPPVGVTPPIPHAHFVLILPLSRGRAGEISETFYKAVFFSDIGEDSSESTFTM